MAEIPFFFIGSRRSGTTLACHITNMNPRLYTPFERYIMWALFHLYKHGTGDGLTAPSMGVFEPLWITFEQSGKAFLRCQRAGSTLEACRKAFFESIHGCRMARGTGNWRKNLVAIGEKNPPEYADPEMVGFILSVHPNARFIHVVRHPAPVVQSHMGFIKRHEVYKHVRLVPDFWKAGPREIFETWVQVEQWVLEAKEVAPVITVRYEDLCERPVEQAHRLYNFFGVQSTDRIDRRIAHFLKDNANRNYDLAVPNGVAGLGELMERYSYE